MSSEDTMAWVDGMLEEGDALSQFDSLDAIAEASEQAPAMRSDVMASVISSSDDEPQPLVPSAAQVLPVDTPVPSAAPSRVDQDAGDTATQAAEDTGHPRDEPWRKDVIYKIGCHM